MKKTLLLMLAVFIAAVTSVVVRSAASETGAEHGGDILYTKPVQSVLFSHEKHSNGAGLGCDACHSGIFEMASLAAQKMNDFTMQGLYKGKYCGACHDGSMAFAAKTQCARCHVGAKALRNQAKAKQPAAGR